MRTSSFVAAFSFVLASASLGLPACTVVLSGEEPFRCEMGVPDPCPPDFRCSRGACVPTPCDIDGDGWGCGGTVDCADDDPEVFPTAEEVCDGVDNDCDGSDNPSCPSGEACQRRGPGEAYRCLRTDDCLVGASVCTEQQRCDASTGQCVDRTATDCRTVGCSGTQECDTLTGLCFAPKELGAACIRNLECATGACFPAVSLTRGAVGGVCSMPCCSDDDCAGVSGTCLATGTGVRGCVPRMATAPACARETDCSGTCRLDANRTFSCTAMVADGLDSGDACRTDEECYSGLCLDDRCAEPCASSLQCDATQACRYRNTRSLLSPMWVTACTTPERNVANDEPCTEDLDCREKYCQELPTGARCSGVCCADDQCSRGFVCRPVRHNGWELRCVRP